MRNHEHLDEQQHHNTTRIGAIHDRLLLLARGRLCFYLHLFPFFVFLQRYLQTDVDEQRGTAVAGALCILNYETQKHMCVFTSIKIHTGACTDKIVYTWVFADKTRAFYCPLGSPLCLLQQQRMISIKKNLLLFQDPRRRENLVSNVYQILRIRYVKNILLHKIYLVCPYKT